MKLKTYIGMMLAAAVVLPATVTAQNKPFVEARGNVNPVPLPPGGPAPRLSDGKVDLSGVWFSGPTGKANAWSVVPDAPVKQDPMPYQPWLQQKLDGLSRADRQFKDLLAPGGLRQVTELETELKTELLYLIAKCGGGKRVDEVRSLYGMDAIQVLGDHEVDQEKTLLQGPTLDQIDALMRNVREELQPVKDLLDQIPGGPEAPTTTDIPARLQRVIPLLRDAGVHSGADLLEQQCAQLSACTEQTGGASRDVLAAVAEALLFVDSTLEGLLKSQGILRTSGEQGQAAATQMMARTILDEARIQMLNGAREAVETVKRGVTGFVESGHDAQMLAGAEQQLATVKGALAILEHRHAARVAATTAEILMSAVAAAQSDKAKENLAESLADILICLEYYMTALGNDETPDPIMLKLADESLASLRG